jgi:hypothetical protein
MAENGFTYVMHGQQSARQGLRRWPKGDGSDDLGIATFKSLPELYAGQRKLTDGMLALEHYDWGDTAPPRSEQVDVHRVEVFVGSDDPDFEGTTMVYEMSNRFEGQALWDAQSVAINSIASDAGFVEPKIIG